jgi:hypothetical protein
MNTYSHLAKSKEKETAEKFGNILKALWLLGSNVVKSVKKYIDSQHNPYIPRIKALYFNIVLF